MRLLDRYIVKLFIQNYLILWVVLGGLYLVVDLIIDLDEFLQAGREHADRFGGVFLGSAWVIADYYGPMFLLVFTVLSGLLVVGALGFSISQMQRNRELTAVLASGISLYRVAAPVLVTGFLINLLILPVHELMIPGVAEKLVRSKSDVGQPTVDNEPVNYAKDNAGSLISAAAFNVDTRVLSDVRIIERDDRGRQTRLIRADAAEWSVTEQAWVLANGRAYDTEVREDQPAAGIAGVAIDQYATELSPDVLIMRQDALYIRLQSLQQLHKMRTNAALTPERRSRVTQIMWGRFTALVMGVLIMLMALPFFLTRVPGNLLKNSAKAAGITVGAWAGGLIMVQAAGLNPVTTALLPVLLFMPLAFYQITTIKT